MLGNPYLSNHPDRCFNVSICPVACPLLTSKIFGLVNEEESNNKSLHLDPALEKFWVMQCGRLRLCTAVDMGTTINNCWKLFR